MRHDGMFQRRSQHHHFFQLCKIREVDGFLKASVFDRNLGFSVMTCPFCGFRKLLVETILREGSKSCVPLAIPSDVSLFTT